MTRSGKEYLEGLNDNRCIYMNGERIQDVRTHPALKGISETIAKLYDVAQEEEELMTYVTEDGTRANKIFMIPRSREDLASRRKAITRWAEETFGLVGRSPDHVAGFLAGFASKPEVFARGGEQFSENVQRFYKHVRDDDKFVSYVIIPPQIDRSKSAHELDEQFLATGVYEEREDGIVIRGSQMLGTSTAVSDYLFVSCIVPLKPGDENYAVSFAVPVGSPGLKLYARPGYAMDKSSTFDYPLSTRFDETDALVVFDDVFIPWEDVFVYKNVELTRAQFFETPAHVLGNNQSQTRFVTKLKFALGLAKKITAMNGIDKIPSVQEKLGELASLAASAEGMLLSSEYESTINSEGVAIPNRRFLYGIMGMQSSLYPKVMHLLREIAGGGVLQVPSSYKELINDETKGDLNRYIRSPIAGPEEKVKLFKLAWDLIGTEFGGRHQQYEMFYAGAPHIAKANAFRNYGYEETEALVDKCLNGYGLPEKVAAK